MVLDMQNPASIMPRIEDGAFKRAGGRGVSLDRNTGKVAENEQAGASRGSWLNELVGTGRLLSEYKTELASGTARTAGAEKTAEVRDYISQLAGEQQKAAAQARAMREQMTARKDTRETASKTVQKTMDSAVVSQTIGNKRVY